MLKLRSTGTALGLGLVFLLSGCLGDTNTGPDETPNVTGPFLVFVSDRNGNPNLYRVETDGTGLQQLTGPPGTDAHPDCKVDGSVVAFDSYGRRAGNQVRDIFVIDRSPQIRRITERTGEGEHDVGPSWGPDGDRMAFITSDRPQFGGVDDRLATMSDAGSTILGVGEDVRAQSVDWSAGAHGLAVSMDADGDADLDLLRMDPDGSNARRVADDPDRDETEPAWAGTSDRIAFTRSDPQGGSNIYSVRADGTGLTQLTDAAATDAQPAWSPDGSRLAFASDRSGNWEIYIMDSGGGDLRQVTDGSARDEMPTWCVR